ncbi:MAG: hypothetical protein K0S76_2329 [Herbinix sp.]|jgi:hypothetical protein|nr:hypothetical protein [Herbinix sp.]
MAETDYTHIAAIMEAAMPHVDTKTKMSMDIMSKLLAFMGCFQSMKRTNMTACGFEDQKINAEGLLSSIRPLCRGRELAIVDQILSMFNAKKMFEAYKMYTDAMKTMQGFENSPFGNFNSGDDSESNSDNSTPFDFSSFFDGYANQSDSDPQVNNDQEVTTASDDDPSTASINKSTDHPKDKNDSNNNSSQNNMLDMLKAMVPPEQQSTFENLSMLFNTMSYDNNKSKPM